MFSHIYNHIYLLKEPRTDEDRQSALGAGLAFVVNLGTGDMHDIERMSAALHECVMGGGCAAVYCSADNDNSLAILLHYLIVHVGMRFANAFTLLYEHCYPMQIDPALVLALVRLCGLDYPEDEVQSRNFVWNMLAEVGATPSPVLPDLYVGSFALLEKTDLVRALGISSVLRLDHLYGRGDLQWPADFTLLDMPINDGEIVNELTLRKGTAFIHAQRQAGKKVLVHCIAGASRSVTFALAYLIEYLGMTLADAYSLIVFHRAVAYPHHALIGCLIPYYQLPDDPADFDAEGAIYKVLPKAAVRVGGEL